MGRTQISSGQRYGRLTLIEIARRDKYGGKVWECRCDCGNIAYVHSTNLRSGKTKSCGCLARENTKERNRIVHTSHGKSDTPLYRHLQVIKQRCYNPGNKDYENYGARGIKVCAEWLEDYLAFEFWAKNSGYEDGLTIDRINNDGDYSPENCKWATMLQQSNNKRTNHYIEIDGVTKTLTEWCRVTGANKRTVYNRIQRGWEKENLFAPPLYGGWREAAQSGKN